MGFAVFIDADLVVLLWSKSLKVAFVGYVDDDICILIDGWLIYCICFIICIIIQILSPDFRLSAFSGCFRTFYCNRK